MWAIPGWGPLTAPWQRRFAEKNSLTRSMNTAEEASTNGWPTIRFEYSDPRGTAAGAPVHERRFATGSNHGRDRNPGAGQGVPPVPRSVAPPASPVAPPPRHRSRRHRPDHPARRDLRAARPERRRQNDSSQDPRRLAPSQRRHDPHRWRRPHRRREDDPRARRPDRVRRAFLLLAAHGEGESPVLRDPVRISGLGPRRTGDAVPHQRGHRGPGRHAVHAAVDGHATEARRGPRALARSIHPLDGRGDALARPGVPLANPQPRDRSDRTGSRSDHSLLDPRPGRGRVDLRPRDRDP